MPITFTREQQQTIDTALPLYQAIEVGNTEYINELIPGYFSNIPLTLRCEFTEEQKYYIHRHYTNSPNLTLLQWALVNRQFEIFLILVEKLNKFSSNEISRLSDVGKIGTKSHSCLSIIVKHTSCSPDRLKTLTPTEMSFFMKTEQSVLNGSNNPIYLTLFTDSPQFATNTNFLLLAECLRRTQLTPFINNSTFLNYLHAVILCHYDGLISYDEIIEKLRNKTLLNFIPKSSQSLNLSLNLKTFEELLHRFDLHRDYKTIQIELFKLAFEDCKNRLGKLTNSCPDSPHSFLRPKYSNKDKIEAIDDFLAVLDKAPIDLNKCLNKHPFLSEKSIKGLIEIHKKFYKFIRDVNFDTFDDRRAVNLFV